MTVRRIDQSELASIRSSSLHLSVEIVASDRGGRLVPRVGGKSIHSTVDPVGEAGRLIDRFLAEKRVPPGAVVLLLGNGFGYAAQTLRDRGFSPVAFEPSAEVISAFARTEGADAFVQDIPLFHLHEPSSLHRAGGHLALIKESSAILVLPHVRMTFPGFAEAVERKVKAIKASAGSRFRVSVVNSWEGGTVEISKSVVAALRDAGYSTDLVDLSGFRAVPTAVEELCLGKGVDFEREIDRLFDWSTDLIQLRVDAFDPAVVLVLAQAPLSLAGIDALKASGRRVVFWFFEDFGLFRYWEASAPRFDVFLTIQKGSFPSILGQMGQKAVHYLPLAADENVFQPMRLSAHERRRYGSPLSFMGAGYRNRVRFFGNLVDRDFKIWGDLWPAGLPVSVKVQEEGRRVTPEESAKIFNASDININLHSSTCHDGPNPFGDYVNPRTFEIAACGGFQVVDRRALLPELLDEGKEIACFSGKDDFLALLDHYLAHPGDRSRMAEAARVRVLREHTYRERVRELFEVIFEHAPPDQSRRIESASEMATSGGAGWAELLSDFPPDRPVDFGSLYQKVSSSLGERLKPFSRTESILMMLGELRRGGR